MNIHLVSAFLLCWGLSASAQENSTPMQIVEHKGQLLIQQMPLDQFNPKRLHQDNTVTVLQIGHNNTVNTQVHAHASELTYTQVGDQNLIDITTKGDEVKQLISQYGDQNTFESFNTNPSTQQNFELIQQGNRQDVSVFGENSLSKDMKISIEGNDKTLIIRNFN